jgi:hypothetical protein
MKSTPDSRLQYFTNTVTNYIKNNGCVLPYNVVLPVTSKDLNSINKFAFEYESSSPRIGYEV